MLAVLVLAAAWVVAPTTLSRDVLYELIGLVAVAGVVLGTVVRAPRSRVAWLLTAAGVLLLVGGDAMYSWYQDVLGVSPFPSPADAVYLSAYPVLAGALMVLVRSRGAGRDLVGILDAAVVTLSLGLVAWIVVGAPIVAEQGVTPSSLLSMAYPAADVMLLGVTARLTFGRGHRPLAYRLLVASIVLLTVADGAYTLLGSTAAASSRWLDATWLTSYVLAGAAALHPTMVDLSEPALQERRITGRRLAGLTLAILVAPTAELLELLNGTGRNLWAVLIFSTALMAVVLSRLQLALHQAQRAVRQREQLHDRLVHQSAHDSLTKASSRAHFLDAIENRLRALDAAENPVGLLYLDLDHFKQVNDTFGHAVGDQVLQRVVDRIRHVVRADDLVGRVGGDEFVVLVHDANSEGLLVDIATRLLKAIERRMQVGEHSLWLSASIGVARSQPGMDEPDELIRNADAAAYQAKSEGRARVQVFGEQLREELRERADAEDAIRRGMAAGEFLLYYQPLVELSTGTVVGYEALARWQRPGHGLVQPCDFIPVAERSSLICDIGRWALTTAAAQAAAWDHYSRPHTQMSVNISGRHLASSVIVDDVLDACGAAGIGPERLVLEVTETVPLDAPVMRAQLIALRRLGVEIHIDDFGTGYTSIGQMRNLPASALKIDRSLIALDDPGARELVALAVHAAHAAGLKVVGEGVETQAELSALQDVGCDLVQGFHLARPAPAEQIVPPSPASDLVTQ